MRNLEIKIDPDLPPVEKIITAQEADKIYFVMANHVEFNTNNQSGNNASNIGNGNNVDNRNFRSIKTKYASSGFLAGVLSSIIADLIIKFLSK